MMAEKRIYDAVETQGDIPPGEILNNVLVLFADDDPDTIKLLEFMAGSLGWEYKSVTSASQMIDAVNESERSFDSIIADVNYFNEKIGPRITGITAAREIRKIMPDIPIVFISGYVNSIIREEIRRVNAEVIEKPFDYTKLFIKITQLIYWNRLAMRQSYSGPERRFNSINHSGHMRRSTDKKIAISERVRDAIVNAREKYTNAGTSK